MIEIIIARDASARCLYTEQIDLPALGELRIRRASSVEPDERGQWWADLSISRGPLLGPFISRSAALAAEAQWLHEHCLRR